MQWTRWVHGSVAMCTSMGMPGRARGFLWWHCVVCCEGATGGRCCHIHGAMLQDGTQPLHLALGNGEGLDATARLLLEEGAPADAVDKVGAWECGNVEELGHTWERVGLLVGSVCGMLRKGHLLQDRKQPLHHVSPWMFGCLLSAVWLLSSLCRMGGLP